MCDLVILHRKWFIKLLTFQYQQFKPVYKDQQSSNE